MSEAVSAEVVHDLAPSGTLRAAINFGNSVLAQQDAATGEPRGVSADLARELARRLGVGVDFTTYDTAGKVAAGATTGAWDIAFLAIDPTRAVEIEFTPPYVVIEGTYMVPSDSPLKRIEDVDVAGIRIAVGQNSAYDLFLSRAVKNAELVRAPTSMAALELFMSEGLEAAAGVKQPLVAFANSHPNLRVMEGRFMAINQAMAMPRGRDAGATYLRQFIEDMKRSGFVAEGLARSGQGDAEVAPAASS